MTNTAMTDFAAAARRERANLALQAAEERVGVRYFKRAFALARCHGCGDDLAVTHERVHAFQSHRASVTSDRLHRCARCEADDRRDYWFNLPFADGGPRPEGQGGPKRPPSADRLREAMSRPKPAAPDPLLAAVRELRDQVGGFAEEAGRLIDAAADLDRRLDAVELDGALAESGGSVLYACAGCGTPTAADLDHLDHLDDAGLDVRCDACEDAR